MVQSEEEVLKAAQAILEQKQYQKLRNYIYVSEACSLTHMAQLWGRGNVANANRAFLSSPQINGRRCSLCSRTDVTVRFCTARELQYCALAPIPLPLSPKK